MDVVRNEIITEELYYKIPPGERESYQFVPEELNRAARRKLGVNQSAKVSFISNGKLSKWARQERLRLKRLKGDEV